MKGSALIPAILFLSACTQNRQEEIIVQPDVPSVVISGHYSETLRNDSETMRRAMEIQSVIGKEKAVCE